MQISIGHALSEDRLADWVDFDIQLGAAGASDGEVEPPDSAEEGDCIHGFGAETMHLVNAGGHDDWAGLISSETRGPDGRREVGEANSPDGRRL